MWSIFVKAVVNLMKIINIKLILTFLKTHLLDSISRNELNFGSYIRHNYSFIEQKLKKYLSCSYFI